MKTKESITIGIIVVISFMIGFRASNYLNPTSEPDANGLDVVYLYPERCINCERHIPPTCGDCNTFYLDQNILSALGDDLGVNLKLHVSDAVYEPSIFITYGNKATLASAKGKLAIANALCSGMNVEKSCNIVEASLSGVGDCISKYNVTDDTLLYHHGSSCEECERTKPFVRELETLAYDGESYKVLWIDDENSEQMKILKECASDYMDLNYIPQVFCAANVRSKTGRMILSELRDFADDCIDAAG